MLIVEAVEFWKNVEMKNGQPIFSERYNHIQFKHYPITVEALNLAIHFRAIGDFDGYYFVRVRLGDQIIHETSLNGLHGRDAGGGGNFGIVANIQQITFPSPGVYTFDIIIEDPVLYSMPLTVEPPIAPRK